MKSIPNKDMAILLRKMATLINANIDLISCLKILEDTSDTQLRVLIYNLRKHLTSGQSLHASLKLTGTTLDPFILQMLKLGEESGSLGMILDILANSKEKQLALKKEFIQTLTYPALLLTTAVVIFVFLLTFVIPKFADFFETSNQPLPSITLFTFSLARHLNASMPTISLSLVILSFIIIRHVRKNLTGLIDICACIPGIASFVVKVHIYQVLLQLSIALSAGMPLTKCLISIKSGKQPNAVTNHLECIHKSTLEGKPLYYSMQTTKQFPDIIIHIVKIGEMTGQLDKMLRYSSDMLQEEISQQLSLFTKLIEPLIMIVLGVLIGGLVIAMYLPIFNIGMTIQ